MDIEPQNSEAGRLQQLARYQILDTPPEQAFDDITRLAAYICDTPLSLVVLIDESRQWFKSRYGLENSTLTETPREVAFCIHALHTPDDLLVVADMREDERFANNPFVTGEPHVRFYAGAPLVSRSGHVLGTLCVMDNTPRQLSEEQLNALRNLARQVMAQFELRIKTQEQAQLLEQLGASEARFAAFMNNGPLLAFIKDAEGHFVYVNPLWEARFQKTAANFLGKTDFDLYPPEVARTIRTHDAQVMAGQVTVRQMESTPVAGGEWKYWMVYKFPLLLPTGRYLACAALDVTEQQRVEEELRGANRRLGELSVMDSLTGLLNRRGCELRLREEIQRAGRHGRPLSLLLMEVDEFQQFTDVFGHQAGDAALINLAHLLRLKTRESDLLAHYGGEDFVAVLPETDHEGAISLGHRIRSAVGAAAWKERRITVSIGVATARPTQSGNLDFDAESLFAEAEVRQYQARQRGNNQIAHE